MGDATTKTVIGLYSKLKSLFKKDEKSNEVAQLIREISLKSLDYLKNCERAELTSHIKGKKYFSFKVGDKISRPVNSFLFNDNRKMIGRFFDSLMINCYDMPSENITKTGYTIAMSFCCLIDLCKVRDQKTPATFFEYFMGHIFARRFGVNPKNRIEVLSGDINYSLPTDFIFDLGIKKPKFHLPVKTSTRERVIQVWAHQRVIDGVYGTGRYSGILACLTETKLDREKLEVIEICLPDQWKIYQMFISKLSRIYYLDVPNRYNRLNEEYPKINVKPLGDFFHEKDFSL